MQNREFVHKIKKKQINVSVVVPVYNVEKYLKRALDSLSVQTLKEIEFIIINDGSTDNSGKVIEQFLGDSRFIYIKQENKGLGAARNRGLKIARGKYVAFLDSDDYVDEDFYEKLYLNIEKYAADIVATSIIRKRETFEKWRVHYEKTAVYTDKIEQFKAISYPEQSYVWNKLYRKTFLDSINFTFQEGVYYEDIVATLKLILACNKLVCIEGTNYYYMVNDGTSIVKSKKTYKKEKDRYENQKFSRKTLIENNIPLEGQSRFIKKHEYTFLNLPLLKVKEDILYKKELFLLFNLIPILYINQNKLTDIKIFLKRLFSITNIDSHILIMFLFIKLNIKYSSSIKEPKITSSALNKTKRDKKIIASLTTFPDRINSVSKTIKTIMAQTVLPDEIVLYLAKSQFPKLENELPKQLLELKKYGLQIKWYKDDIKSYKKLIPALLDYPDDIIITFDDDIYYEKDTIEVLYNSYLKNSKEIQANRIWRIKVSENTLIPLHSSYLMWNEEEYKIPSYKNTIIGCGGVLYPPNCLYKDVLDDNKFKEIVPTQDDIWFWAMAVLAGTKIRLNKGYSYNHITVENTQQSGLCKINTSKKQGISGKDGFNRMLEFYPEILDILNKD